MGVPNHRFKCFRKFSEWRRFRAHASFLEHDVALRIKFAKHRSQQALRLHPHPEFQFIGRHGDEISCDVGGRESIHARGAGRSVDAVELVLHQHFALLRDQLAKILLEFLVALGLVLRFVKVIDLALTPRPAHERLLRAHFGAHTLLFTDDLHVLFVVLCADRWCALEHHVFEEVSNTCDAGPLVRAAHVRHPTGCDGRVVMPLHEQHTHPIGERMLRDRNFLGNRGRPCRRKRDDQPTASKKSQAFHPLKTALNLPNVNRGNCAVAAFAIRTRRLATSGNPTCPNWLVSLTGVVSIVRHGKSVVLSARRLREIVRIQ
jgi:hypothetical protein